MSQPLRRLLPAGKEQKPGQRKAERYADAAVLLRGIPRKRQRTTLHIACDPCRGRRTACDGNQPSCSGCRRRDIACSYRVERRTDLGRLQGHAELVGHLRSLPEADAIQLLRRLRALPDPAGFLASFEGGAAHSVYRPSQLETDRATASPTPTRVEFELMMRHRPSFRSILPIDMSVLERLVRIGSLPPQLQSHAWPKRQYCDDRLQRLRIDYWTRVPISDEVAARVISAYLETDHLFIGLFDADAVLDDLVECRTNCCSALLVSSLMFLACQSYTAVDVTMAPLSLRFFGEAQMLCQGDRGEKVEESVHTVAAIMLFVKACFFHGRDSVGYDLLRTGRDMAKRLGLFDVPPDDPKALSLLSMSPEFIRTASVTAWEAYNFLAFVSNLYPCDPVTYPPILPQPLHTLDANSPRHLSPVFPAVCKLWEVAHEANLVYKSPSTTPIQDRVPLAFLEAKYRKLLDCMDHVEEDLIPHQQSPTHVLVLHILFHMIALTLLRPFVGVKNFRLPSFSSLDSCPKALYNASVNQLKQLIFWSSAQGHPQAINVYLNAGFLVLLGDLLKGVTDDPNGSSKRLFFLLCIRCCADLYVSYPIFAHIAQAYLTMGLQHEVISGAEATALFVDLKKRGLHHDAPDEAIATSYLDYELATTEPEKAQVHLLAQQFESLSLLGQFTTVEYVAPSEVEQAGGGPTG